MYVYVRNHIFFLAQFGKKVHQLRWESVRAPHKYFTNRHRVTLATVVVTIIIYIYGRNVCVKTHVKLNYLFVTQSACKGVQGSTGSLSKGASLIIIFLSFYVAKNPVKQTCVILYVHILIELNYTYLIHVPTSKDYV